MLILIIIFGKFKFSAGLDVHLGSSYSKDDKTYAIRDVKSNLCEFIDVITTKNTYINICKGV